MITYNMCCITDNCDSTTVQRTNKKAKCDHCNKTMKVLGISTNILHKGTQEALNKMRR